MSIEQKGSTSIDVSGQESKFKLVCNTNINRVIQNQISWIKDDKDLLTTDNLFYTQFDLRDTQFANSVLEFKINKLNFQSFNYSGVYKCKIHIRYPEVGEGTSYLSESTKIELNLNEPLKYNSTSTNITLPTLPGILLEVPCQVYGLVIIIIIEFLLPIICD